MQAQRHSCWVWFLLLTLVFIVSGCNGQETDLTPVVVPTVNTPVVTDGVSTAVGGTATAAVTGEASHGVAFIESVQVVMLESFPVQVQASVNGSLSDGCTSLAGIDVRQEGTTFVLDVQTAYSDAGGCTQALVPFSETVALNVQGLAAGTYTVTADGVSEAFTLAVDNELPATPETGSATLTVGVTSAQPGGVVSLTGEGFPAQTMVEIGIGPVDSEYEIIAGAQTDENGRFVTDVTVPDYVEAGQEWVFVAAVNNNSVLASPITIVDVPENGDGSDDGESPDDGDAPDDGDGPEDGEGETPDEGVNVPVNGQFTRTYMYLIALGDAGQSGTPIGCDDSVIPVIIDIEPTVAPLTAAINRLLSLTDQYYGQSGLYNALYQSDLTLQGINIVNGEAIIALTGSLQLGGACDNPRVLAQLEQTALQYSTVHSVTILLNGEPLEEQLSGEG